MLHLLRCTPSHVARCSEVGTEAAARRTFRVPFRSAPQGGSERNSTRHRSRRRRAPGALPLDPEVCEAWLRCPNGEHRYGKAAPDDRSRQRP
jgi:hypothetical protein